MRITATLAIAALLAGCQMHSEKASLSSGRIGCPPQQITISEDAVTFNTASWKAQCGGMTYYCVRRAYEDTNCTAAQQQPNKPALATPPEPTVVPSAPAATPPSKTQYQQEQLKLLMQQSLPYEEYMKRYKAIMGGQ